MTDKATTAPARSSVTTPRETSPQSPGGLRRWAVILPELVALALCIPMWLATNEWTSSVGGPGPAFYPRLLIGLLVAAMIVRLIQDVTSIRRGVAEPDEDSMVMEEGVEMDVRTEAGVRPGGRPFVNVVGDNAEQEFGSSRMDRFRLLGRAGEGA